MPSVQKFDTEEISWGFWIEICTANPLCIYYFGDFSTYLQAQCSIVGHLEDLQAEGAKIISIQVKQCQPKKLVLLGDEIDNLHLDFSHPKLEL